MARAEGEGRLWCKPFDGGKDSVIIRHRLEKLPPNPEIDSPARERASVRNPLHPSPPSRTYQFFFPLAVGKKGVKVCMGVSLFFLAKTAPRDTVVVSWK